MKSARELTVVGVFTAILLGGQFALSAISGVEVVTVLLLAFCFVFGAKKGFMVANAFSILRCIIFGFFPTAIILYLIYYNLFVMIFGTLGNCFNHSVTLKKHIILIVVALFCTLLFTMLDNVITPLFYGFDRKTTLAYYHASLFALVPHLICTIVTVGLLFLPIYRILIKLKNHE